MINPGSNIKIPTGLKVDIPEGLALQIINKSGVALKKGLLVGASLIDSSYKGEFNFHFINSTSKQCFISKGEKICQAVIINDYIGL
jgi:dUTP pyrophosphatase